MIGNKRDEKHKISLILNELEFLFFFSPPQELLTALEKGKKSSPDESEENDTN